MEDDCTFPQRAAGATVKPNPTTEATQRAAGPNFFRDGENVQFMRADRLVSHSFSDNVLRLKVKTSHQTNRTAQTHDTVMHQFVTEDDSFGEMHFEICFTTPSIFRVKFAGSERILQALTDNPAFPPPEARMLAGVPQVMHASLVERLPDSILLHSELVDLHVHAQPFRLRACRRGCPVPFWKQRLSDLFTSDIIPTSIVSHETREATFDAFALDPQEQIFGLGERFDSVSRRGRPVDFVNHDAIGTSNTRSYINVPFFWSTNGYGCFVNSTARTEWDVGVSEAATLGFSTEENFMDYFIIQGQQPKDILQQYANDLTGTAPIPPVWAFGLWFSRNSYQNWGVVDDVLQKASELEIPVDVVHLDTAWFQVDWNPDLLFGDRFPEPEKKMASLKARGVRVSLWQYNFVPPQENNRLFVEARDGGFVGMKTNPDGTRGSELFSYPTDTTGWRTDDCVIDFSNPAAAAWYGEKIKHLIRQGASAIKTDFGDCISPDAHYLNIAGRRFQNLYSLVYNAVIRKAVTSVNEDTAQWARSGTAGSQRYPVHWGGDSQCSFSALQGSLRATLSIGLSGFPYFSHDIGGFIGKPTPELYVRWAQLAMFSSHTRSHGAGDDNGREPWYFGDRAVEIFRKFVTLRYRLLPYIIEQARSGAALGLPVVRALVLEYPNDRNTWGIDTQYLFGSDLMIAPTLQPHDEADKHTVYLPKGTWFGFWDKQKITSRGEWIELDAAPLDSMHIWVKAGAMLCWAKQRMTTGNEVGTINKIELYGHRQGGWKCGDGQGGFVLVEKDEDGKWVCKSHDNVQVEAF